jgi:hypothetical protein
MHRNTALQEDALPPAGAPPLVSDEDNSPGATSSWLQLPISMVSSATETKTCPTTVGEVLAGIRSGKWAGPVKRVRDHYAKAYETAVEEGNPDPSAIAKRAVHRRKRDLPAVTFSGAFSRREDSAIESPGSSASTSTTTTIARACVPGWRPIRLFRRRSSPPRDRA